MWYLTGMGIAFVIILLLLVSHVAGGGYKLTSKDYGYAIFLIVVWPVLIVALIGYIFRDEKKDKKWPA